jgi:hypothetical protein
MPIKCRVWWDDTSQAYVLSCSYSQGFIEALKKLIPSGDRNFDPNTKFWYFKEQYGEMLRQLAQTSFGLSSVSFVSKQVASQSRQAYSNPQSAGYVHAAASGGGTTEDAVVAFFSLVPYDAAKRCYLLAAQALHPDKPEGDGAKMSKLNELWKRIEKEFYKR